MQNVHDYDNKLQDSIKTLEDKIATVTNISSEERQSKFQELISHMIDEVAKKNLSALLKSLEYDPINKIHTEHLLLIIINALIKDNWDQSLLSLLSEQLKDMSSGFCAQGKTIRLLQIAKAL